MKSKHSARREFLMQTGSAAAAAWASVQWPAIVAAGQHAHEAAKSKGPGRLEVLTPEQARNADAFAAQIIPTDELPGAREAGVVYFIDRALKTFAKETLPIYQEGLADLDRLTSENYPGVKSFADASSEQQAGLVAQLADNVVAPRNPRSQRQFDSGDFFRTIWRHTVLGFLADPEAGGNRNYAGWKMIERDPAHSFSPPFGYYDKDYPGWQATSSETEKK